MVIIFRPLLFSLKVWYLILIHIEFHLCANDTTCTVEYKNLAHFSQSECGLIKIKFVILLNKQFQIYYLKNCFRKLSSSLSLKFVKVKQCIEWPTFLEQMWISGFELSTGYSMADKQNIDFCHLRLFFFYQSFETFQRKFIYKLLLGVGNVAIVWSAYANFFVVCVCSLVFADIINVLWHRICLNIHL